MPVPNFSPGEVLTAAAMDAVGLWLVKSQTVGTGVSSVTVTGAFSADYDNYKIVYNGGTGSQDAIINFAFSGSSSGYYAARSLAKYADGSLLGGNTNNGAAWGGAGVASTSGALLNIDVISPFLSVRSYYNGGYSAAITADYAGFTGGFHNVTSSYTGFTLTLSGGNFTGGTIRVYGYRN